MSIIRTTNNYHLTKYESRFDLPTYLKHYTDDMETIDSTLKEHADFIELNFVNITDHENRIETLETCCNEVNNVLTDYGQRISVIEDVIHTVSTQNILDLQSRIGALETKVNTNIDLIHELNDNMTVATARLTKAENDIVTNHNEITSVKGRVTSLEDCCSDVNDKLNAHEVKITKNENDISDMNIRFTRDEANIQGNADDIIILSGQIATNARNIDDITHALSDLDPSSQLEIVRQVTLNTSSISALQDLTNAHTSRLDNYATRFANDEVRITDLERRMTVTEAKLEAVDDWQQQIDDTISRVDAVETRLDADEAIITVHGTRLDNLETCCSDMQSYVSTNNIRVQGVEDRCTNIENKVTSITARVTTNEDEIDTIKDVIEHDEESLSALTTRVGNIESDIGSNDISALGSSVKGAILEVFNRLTALKNNVGTLSNLITTAKNTVVDAINEVKQNANTLFAKIGDLANLNTTDKSDVVSAVNEVLGLIDMDAIVNKLFPIGSLYMTKSNTNPSSLLGVGTWSLISDGYLRNNAPSATGGSLTTDSHTLTIDEIPSHNHSIAHTHTMAHTHSINHTHTWSNTHNHGITDRGHSHGGSFGTSKGNRGGSYGDVPVGYTTSTNSATTGISINNATISGTTSDASVTTSGGASNSTTSAASANNSGNTGGSKGHTHSIEPTYVGVYVWERTA